MQRQRVRERERFLALISSSASNLIDLLLTLLSSAAAADENPVFKVSKTLRAIKTEKKVALGLIPSPKSQGLGVPHFRL